MVENFEDGTIPHHPGLSGVIPEDVTVRIEERGDVFLAFSNELPGLAVSDRAVDTVLEVLPNAISAIMMSTFGHECNATLIEITNTEPGDYLFKLGKGTPASSITPDPEGQIKRKGRESNPPEIAHQLSADPRMRIRVSEWKMSEKIRAVNVKSLVHLRDQITQYKPHDVSHGANEPRIQLDSTTYQDILLVIGAAIDLSQASPAARILWALSEIQGALADLRSPLLRAAAKMAGGPALEKAMDNALNDLGFYLDNDKDET